MCIRRRDFGRALWLLAALCWPALATQAGAWEAAGRRVVILGSSTAAGASASTYPLSWAGRLTSTLAERGHTVVNVSVSGHATQDAIDRFAAVVVPLKPHFVVLATSILNEGFAPSPAAANAAYKANLMRLVGMAQAIGAVAVVIGQYPNRAYGEEQRRLIAGLYAWLDDAGLEKWDFWNGLADPEGNWVAGLTVDGTHPLDAGHAYMFDAIPLTFFDVGYKSRTGADPAVWRFLGGNASANGPLSVELDRPAGSWTQSAWFSHLPEFRAVLLSNDSGYSVLIQGGSLQVVDSAGAVVTQAALPAAGPHAGHVALTYSATLGLLTLFVDGVRYPSAAITGARAASFSFAGQAGRSDLDCLDCTLAMPAIHRAALNPNDIASMFGGRIPGKSLELYLPLDESPAIPPKNTANTATVAVANGTWAALGPSGDRDGPVPAPACPDGHRARADCAVR